MQPRTGKYDVVIIGSGIGGLVCGCYLAKAGLNVLIAEKHNKPGGYCTSFCREGYKFDVAVHYFGGLRDGGVLNNILNDLSLKERIAFNRIDPCDKIILPKHTYYIRSDCLKTREGLKKLFYSERHNIDKFFDYVINANINTIYINTVNLTFTEFLKSYFKNKELIAALSTLLGNIGLPPSRASALTSVVLYKEYLFDPGYYPSGGAQSFPDILAKRYLEYGGKLCLSSEVKNIRHSRRKVVGVDIDKIGYVKCKYVVSNADASLTFNRLLDIRNKYIQNKINKLEISPSVFVCYLGINADLKQIINDHCTTWYFKTYNIDKCYKYAANPKMNDINYIICTFPSFHSIGIAPKNKTAMSIMICAKWSTDKIWKMNKYHCGEKLIAMASDVVPNLSKYIEIKSIATPNDFYKYTYNKKGAMYGWAALPHQINNTAFPQKTFLDNLYIAGHWSANGVAQSGIPVVAISGKSAAKLIIKNIFK